MKTAYSSAGAKYCTMWEYLYFLYSCLHGERRRRRKISMAPHKYHSQARRPAARPFCGLSLVCLFPPPPVEQSLTKTRIALCRQREGGRDCSATRGSLVAVVDVRYSRREEDPLLFLTSSHPIRARYLDPSFPVVGMGFEGDGCQKKCSTLECMQRKSQHIFLTGRKSNLLI